MESQATVKSANLCPLKICTYTVLSTYSILVLDTCLLSTHIFAIVMWWEMAGVAWKQLKDKTLSTIQEKLYQRAEAPYCEVVYY